MATAVVFYPSFVEDIVRVIVDVNQLFLWFRVHYSSPSWFGAILGLIAIAEGESVGHAGDNFRGMSTKEEPGFLNFDYLGMRKKLSDEKYAYYKDVEMKVRCYCIV